MLNLICVSLCDILKYFYCKILFESYLSEPGPIIHGNFQRQYVSQKRKQGELTLLKVLTLSNYHVIWRVEPLINEVSKVIWVNEHQFAASHTTIV